jgi:aspartate dehydrogenase
MTGHLALIGLGAIGQGLVEVLASRGAPERLSVLVRAGREGAARSSLEALAGAGTAVEVVTELDRLIAARPGLVVECAGHGAVTAFGAPLLRAGLDLVVASIGALADDALFDGLTAAARAGGAQLLLPSGAIGGIDALAAARLAGIDSVLYTGRKPPAAWAGSPAERAVDLAALTEATVFFEGSAREAARAYPKNANVAATLALAGIGFDATRVRLVADPAADANTHEYSVRSAAVDFTMTLLGKPSPLNPRTSQSTVLSLARAVLNRTATIVL